MADDTKVYPSGLTEKEAEEIQGGLMWGTRIYAAIAILAHILAYMLTPWLKYRTVGRTQELTSVTGN